ncbi:MAG: glycosyltransferase family 4 protein [Candidatus Aenigmarchaeota archaeon]|nr:glycosyltransferase family 4 protein [Candidatus Aenigmarchaeota archaeon]
MKVCFCYHAFYPTKGGVEEVIMQISKVLVKQGDEVTVVTAECPGHPIREKIEGINVIRIKPLFNLMKVPIVPDIGKALSEIDMDILHVHGSIPGFSDNSVLWAKKHNIPCVLTYHFDGNADHLIGNMVAYVYNRTINNLAVSKADIVTATSDSYAQTSPVLKHYIDKVKVIPNGVHLEKFTDVSDEQVSSVKKKYDLEGKKIVLFLGRIVGYKGLDYLVRAMDHIDDATLIIAGPGGLNSSAGTVRESDARDRIRHIGRVSDDDLAGLFTASSVYCLPSISRGENFGITLLEAMVCGIPCVYTDIPGKDHMDSTYSLRAIPKDAKDLADKINTLLKDKSMRKEMGENAKIAVEKYCWSNIVPEYLDIYAGLMKTSRKN